MIHSLSAAVMVAVLSLFFNAVVVGVVVAGTIAFIMGNAKEGYDEDNDGAAAGAADAADATPLAVVVEERGNV